ncbi:unnamed protein product, partial [Meganyctiphanes norvegica]
SEFDSSPGNADGSICSSTRNCRITIRSSDVSLLISIKNIAIGDRHCNEKINIQKKIGPIHWSTTRTLCFRDVLPILLTPGTVRLSFYSSTFLTGMNVSWTPFNGYEIPSIEKSGVILSPGYPDFFIYAVSNKWNYILSFRPPNGSFIYIKLTDFNSNHEDNYIEI